MIPFRKFMYCKAMSLGTFVDKVYLEIPDPDEWWDRDFDGKTPAQALQKDNVTLLHRMFAQTIQSQSGSCESCMSSDGEEIVDGRLICPACMASMSSVIEEFAQ